MIMVGDLGRHPACEPLVEPEVVPPCHGDEIAEPLMRGLVRLDAVDRLARRLAGDRGVVEQDALEGEDRAPILHRAEELRLAGAGAVRSEERRLGNEWVRTCRSRGSTLHK